MRKSEILTINKHPHIMYLKRPNIHQTGEALKYQQTGMSVKVEAIFLVPYIPFKNLQKLSKITAIVLKMSYDNEPVGPRHQRFDRYHGNLFVLKSDRHLYWPNELSKQVSTAPLKRC